MLDWEKLKPLGTLLVSLVPVVAGVLARSALRQRDQTPDLADERRPMNNYGNDRKALYRRLFRYGRHPIPRAKMLAYLFNRLKNDQLRDILDLLDNDPENDTLTESAARRHPAGCECDACRWVRDNRRKK